MRAIRGATTVDSDCADEIKSAVKELLDEIFTVNNLRLDEVVCIMLSNTSDINSYYPAKAAREAGYARFPLYSSLEPEIEGSLARCIRVMILCERSKAVKHVYLREAKSLRKDLTKVLNIAIDGPAGSGKSTISRIIAEKLGILYLDTGAMYRAIALKCVRNNADYADKDAVRHLVNDIDIKVDYRDGRQITLLDGEDVSEQIRTPQVSLLASYVSAYSFVRTKMVELQREIASKFSCVLDGRDIGTNVLPDCEFKFYLTAAPDVRAKRRHLENLSKGVEQSYEEVLKEIEERDFHDKNRAVAPLKKAVDATEVDTSDMSIDEVASLLLSKIEEKI